MNLLQSYVVMKTAVLYPSLPFFFSPSLFVLNDSFTQGWPSSLTGVFSCSVTTGVSTYLGSDKRQFDDPV
jgi:hypothetical protein